MGDIKNRVKELRKTLNLTMEKFGQKLGVTKSTISSIESGRFNATDSMIKLICHVCWNGKFVNEEWLRTGVGEMFLKLPEEDEINGYVSDLLENKNNPFFKIILEAMRTYNQLPPDDQVALLTYSKQFLENLQKKED